MTEHRSNDRCKLGTSCHMTDSVSSALSFLQMYFVFDTFSSIVLDSLSAIVCVFCVFNTFNLYFDAFRPFSFVVHTCIAEFSLAS